MTHLHSKRSLLALVLAVCMLVSATVPAFATTVNTTDPDQNNGILEVEIVGDIDYTGDPDKSYITGVSARHEEVLFYEEEGADPEPRIRVSVQEEGQTIYADFLENNDVDGVVVTMDGDLSVQGNYTTGITASSKTPDDAEAGNTLDFTIDGDIAVQNDSGYGRGLQSYSYNGSEVNVAVNGSISVTGEGDLYGVSVQSFDGSTLQATVDGNSIIVDGERATGAMAITLPSNKPEEASFVSLTVDGDISATGEQYAGGFDLSAQSEGDKAEGQMTGDIIVTVTGERDESAEYDNRWSTGISASASEGGTTEGVFVGDITAEGGNGEGISTYINDESAQGSSVTLDVTGNVSITVDDEARAQGVYSGNDYGEITVGLEGDITVQGGNSEGVFVQTHGEDSVSDITVTGNIDVTGTEIVSGISVYSNEGGAATVQIEGDILSAGKQVDGDSEDASEPWVTGINTYAYTDGTIDVTVDGNISTQNEAGQAIAISAHSSDGSLSSFEVNGDLDANGNRAVGLSASADAGGQMEVNVNGSVDITGFSGNAISATAHDESDQNATVSVAVTGDVNVTELSMGTAVSVDSDHGTVTVDIDGDVKMETGMFVNGVYIFGEDGSAEVNVGGSVIADQVSQSTGVVLTTYNSETEDVDLSLTVGEDVQISAGTYAEAVYGRITMGTSSIEVGGDVTASVSSETGYANGINARGVDGGDITVTVEGSVSADGKNGEAVYAHGENEGTAEVTIAGDVTGTNDAIVVEAMNGGEIKVTVDGDVTAENGVGVTLWDDGDAENPGSGEVVIDGTVSGGQVAVLAEIKEGGELPAVELYVWKLEENADGEIALAGTHMDETGDAEEGTLFYEKDEEATKALEESIWYIIRVEENSDAALSLSGTTKHDDLDVAHQDDMVYLKIDVKDGYHVVGAYNGMEQTELLQDANGNYYIQVPRGGGVQLSVKVEADTVVSEPVTDDELEAVIAAAAEQQPAAQPAKQAAPAAATAPAAPVEEPAPEVVVIEFAEDTEVEELHGLSLEDNVEAAEALSVLGEALEEAKEEGALVEIVNLDLVLDDEELTEMKELPLKQQMLVLVAVIGHEDILTDEVQLDDAAEALVERIQERMSNLSAAARAALEALLAEAFPVETIEIDGVSYDFFVIDVEITTSEGVSIERYGFRLTEEGKWVLTRLNRGEVQ